MPTVSVVVPTHNRSLLLQRALRSVLAQSFDNLEILVIDDASSDDTPGAVAALGDPRVKYLRTAENRGVAHARNVGIAAASGELIAMLDDDDEWLPSKVERQVEVFARASTDVGAVYCGYFEVDQQSSQVIARRLPHLRGRIFDAMLLAGRIAATSTMMVSAKCFERVGTFDTAYEYGEDLDMWLRIARQFAFDYVDDCLTNVFFQPAGLTQDYEAIVAGVELYLARYQEFFDARPALHSAELQRLGTFYCFAGRVAHGRSKFVRAIALDPFALKNYASLALSLLGSGLFRASYAAKDRLLA